MSDKSRPQMIDIPIDLYWPTYYPPHPLLLPPSIQPSVARPHKPTSAYLVPHKTTPRRENGHHSRRRKGLSALLQADTIHVIHQSDERVTESDLPLPVENWPQEVRVSLPEG